MIKKPQGRNANRGLFKSKQVAEPERAPATCDVGEVRLGDRRHTQPRQDCTVQWMMLLDIALFIVPPFIKNFYYNGMVAWIKRNVNWRSKFIIEENERWK